MFKNVGEWGRKIVDTVLPPGEKFLYVGPNIPEDFTTRAVALGGAGALGAGTLYAMAQPDEPQPLITPQIMANYPQPNMMPAQGVMYDKGLGVNAPVGIPVLSQEDLNSQINYFGKRIATDMATLKQLQEMQAALGVPVT